MEIEDQDITDKFSGECRQKVKQKFIKNLALSPSESFEVRVMFNPDTKETTFVSDFGEGLKLEEKHRASLLNMIPRPWGGKTMMISRIEEIAYLLNEIIQDSPDSQPLILKITCHLSYDITIAKIVISTYNGIITIQ